VLGQIAFRGAIAPILEKCSAKRIKEICEQFDLNRNRDYRKGNQLIKVCSVNDVSCQQILQELLPDLVIVEGTRIISKETLSCVSATFINMHTGITPKYRGVHGTYWALYNHDEENAGVTIHFVDEGIDTGNIIYQGPIPITPKDNFTTYSYLQIGIGLQYEIQAINVNNH
jgi:methionyl-tRNA formyltransferase